MENTEQEIKDTVTISPDQLSMLDGTDSSPATHLEIGHNVNDQVGTDAGEEEVPSNTKFKVLAALAVVAVAGYIAYWVQEPVQLKADLLNSSSSSTEAAPGTDSNAVAEASPSDSNTTDSTTPTAAETTGPSKSIDISLFGFEPAALQIDKGTTVIWTNTSAEDQTLIGASKNGDSFTSPVMTSGATFTKKFDKDGEYTYYSTYNPALKATINVGMGAAAVVEGSTEVASADNETVLPTSADTALGAATDTSLSAADLKGSALEATATETTIDEKAVTEELKPAAVEGKQHLAKTGPQDYLYIALLGLIAYFNRRKLAAVFSK